MDQEKESSFKVTDRRKFNVDGTPRESVDNSAAAQPPAEQPQPLEQSQPQAQSQSESGGGKVVSFPGERKKEQPEPKSSSENSRYSAAEQAYQKTSHGKSADLPDASFVTLVNMLAVEAAMHLGLIENPMGAAAVIDFEAARHMIDLLGVLHEKTKGNLSAEEAEMMETILADLRMQFVLSSNRR